MVLKIGITGGGGKVGGVIAKGLLQDPKYEVRLFTFKGPTYPSAYDLTERIISELPRKCEVVNGVDLSIPEQVKGKFEGLDVVIHLAGNPFPWASWLELRGPNFDAVVNVYDECVHSKVKRVIFASSNHTQNGPLMSDPKNYESMDLEKVKRPLLTTDPAFPDCFYALSKLFGEDLGKLYALQHGLEVVALRIGWLKDYDKDDPSDIIGTTAGEYMRSIYLSHRDAIGIAKAAAECPVKPDNGIPFLCVYACSNNTKKIWDLEPSMKALGYQPLDDVEKFYTEKK